MYVGQLTCGGLGKPTYAVRIKFIGISRALVGVSSSIEFNLYQRTGRAAGWITHERHGFSISISASTGR
jgi:hypothetical protein